MPTKIQKEIEKLRQEIEYHNDLYYQQAAPQISDYEFDQLVERLKNIPISSRPTAPRSALAVRRKVCGHLPTPSR
jgi:NAD-dependent DNA ligase